MEISLPATPSRVSSQAGSRQTSRPPRKGSINYREVQLSNPERLNPCRSGRIVRRPLPLRMIRQGRSKEVTSLMINTRRSHYHFTELIRLWYTLWRFEEYDTTHRKNPTRSALVAGLAERTSQPNRNS